MSALRVFSASLRYFRDHALQEVRQDTGRGAGQEVHWVVTVPAIWRQQAKQFMREAAYQAGLASPEQPHLLTIALEPEAASIYCRQVVPDRLLDFCTLTVSSCGPGS